MFGCRSALLGAVLAWALTGCSAMNSCDECWWFNKTASHRLDKGIENYEVGNYIASMTALNEVVQAESASKDDKVSAYKYLAFIHCVSGRERLCYESFRKALMLDSKFELTRAEAGHPVWGPVFRSAKARFAK